MAANGYRVWWWAFFALWVAGQAFAIVYPLTQPRDMGTGFLMIIFSLVAGAAIGLPLACFTAVCWRRLRIYQRILGLFPVAYFFAPLIIFA
jgi:hypothetical protein